MSKILGGMRSADHATLARERAELFPKIADAASLCTCGHGYSLHRKGDFIYLGCSQSGCNCVRFNPISERKGPPAGFLEVGCNDNGEVVVNHPDLEPDENGVGHIVFSPAEARAFANLLLRHADTAQHSHCVQEELRQARIK